MQDETNLRASWVLLLERLREAGAAVELRRDLAREPGEPAWASAWHAAAVVAVDAEGSACLERPRSMRDAVLDDPAHPEVASTLWQVLAVGGVGGGGSRLLGRCRAQTGGTDADGRDLMRLSPPVDLAPADPRRSYRWRSGRQCPVHATLEPTHQPIGQDIGGLGHRSGLPAHVSAKLTNLSPRGVGVVIDADGWLPPCIDYTLRLHRDAAGGEGQAAPVTLEARLVHLQPLQGGTYLGLRFIHLDAKSRREGEGQIMAILRELEAAHPARSREPRRVAAVA